MNRRGRPIGHRLSESTKEKIRQKRLGTSHTRATKDKISRSLKAYFKSKDKLADSIEYEYSYISEEAFYFIKKPDKVKFYSFSNIKQRGDKRSLQVVIFHGKLAEAKDFIRNLKIGDEVTASVIIPETPEGYTVLSLR